MPYVKRREPCILFLEQGFGKDCRDKLVAAGFKVVCFSEDFQEEARLHQSVSDPIIIRHCDRQKYVLFTMDKSMRFTHVEVIKKTEVVIIATESCDKFPPGKWTDALITAKAEFLRYFKNHERPWFGHLKITGNIRKIVPITSDMRTRRNRPREK